VVDIEICSDLCRFEAVADDWNSLVRQSPMCWPHMTHDWLSAWIECFGGDLSLQIILLWNNGELIAAAPLCGDKVWILGIAARRLRFTCSAVSPSCTFILSSHVPSAVDFLCDAIKELSREWDIAAFENLPKESAKQFERHFPLHINDAGRRSPVLDVDRSYEAFLADQSANFRYDIRRAERHLAGKYDVTVKRYDSAATIAPHLPEIFRISSNSWKGEAGTHIGGSAASQKFYEKLATLNSELARSMLWVLELDKTPVAMQWHIRNTFSTYLLRSDFDERWRSERPGHVLQHRVIRDCFSLDITHHHFGGMDYDYKRRFTERLDLHSNLRCYNSRLYSRFLWARQRGLRAASMFLRRSARGR